MKQIMTFCLIWIVSVSSFAIDDLSEPQIVTFSNGKLTLRGELFLPKGEGQFPAILFNHGSASKMNNSIASAALAPGFNKNGWAFFMPYRRGQGLSAQEGPYIMDEINSARRVSLDNAVHKLVELHQVDHLSDQMAGLSWLQKQSFIDINRIATLGNSFGGIQVVLGVAKGSYCAGISSSGAAQSWRHSKGLQKVMKRAVANANSPILFFQAENDYDLSPTKILSSHMQASGKLSKAIIYPPFGSSVKGGHSLLWKGVSIWFGDALSFIRKYCINPHSK